MLIINCQEAEVLCNFPIGDVEEMRKAAKLVSKTYRTTTLVKSGDRYKDKLYDVLRTHADEEWVFEGEMIFTRNSHGASCTFASAIATYLALGYKMHEAVSEAREFVRNAIQYGDDVFIGHGSGPVCPTFEPEPMKFIDN